MIKPTDSELEILQLLWQHQPCSVRFINDHLNDTREVGYTTTLKIMQIMYEKGLVSRNTESRSHTYTAIFREAETKKSLLQSFLENTFRGNTSDLILSALGNSAPSKDELVEIKELINQLEKNQ